MSIDRSYRRMVMPDERTERDDWMIASDECLEMRRCWCDREFRMRWTKQQSRSQLTARGSVMLAEHVGRKHTVRGPAAPAYRFADLRFEDERFLAQRRVNRVSRATLDCESEAFAQHLSRADTVRFAAGRQQPPQPASTAGTAASLTAADLKQLHAALESAARAAAGRSEKQCRTSLYPHS